MKLAHSGISSLVILPSVITIRCGTFRPVEWTNSRKAIGFMCHEEVKILINKIEKKKFYVNYDR